MPVCVVIGCKTGHGQQKIPAGIMLHRFPLKDPEKLAKWVKNVGKEGFRPTGASRICSLHFAEDDYFVGPQDGKRTPKRWIRKDDGVIKLLPKSKTEKLKQKVLKPDAIPFVENLETESGDTSNNVSSRTRRSGKATSVEERNQAETDETAKGSPIKRNSPRISAGVGTKETNVPSDELKNLDDLEQRLTAESPPQGFTVFREGNSLVLCLIQKDPQLKTPVIRGSIEVKQNLEFRVALDNKPISKMESDLYDPALSNGKLQKFSQLDTLTMGVISYAEGHKANLPLLDMGITCLGEFLVEYPAHESLRRKITFALEQIKLAKTSDGGMLSNRQVYSPELMEFAVWVLGISPDIYQQLEEHELFCLPPLGAIQRFRKIHAPPQPKREPVKLTRIPAGTPLGATVSAMKTGLTPLRKSDRKKVPTEKIREGNAQEQDVIVHDGTVSKEEVVVDQEPRSDEGSDFDMMEDGVKVRGNSPLIMQQNEQDLLAETSASGMVEESYVQYPWFPDAAVPFRQQVHNMLQADTAIRILSEPRETWFSAGNLWRPKAGDLYLLDLQQIDANGEVTLIKPQEYRKDGYFWFTNSAKKSSGKAGLHKMAWVLKQKPTEEERAEGETEVIDQRFQRFEYTIDDEIVLIHYVGDETVAAPWSEETPKRHPKRKAGSVAGKRKGPKPGTKKKPYALWNISPARPVGPHGKRMKRGPRRAGATSLDPKDISFENVSMAELYADLPPHAARPFRRGAQIINVDDALECLLNPTPQILSWGDLYFPKGGDVFLLDLSMYDLERNQYAYREDGYKWLMYSKRSQRVSWVSSYTKTYWYLKQPSPFNDDKAYDKRFCRFEYTIDGRFVLIHYTGDETIVDFSIMGDGVWVRDRGYIKRNSQDSLAKQEYRAKRMPINYEEEGEPIEVEEGDWEEFQWVEGSPYDGVVTEEGVLVQEEVVTDGIHEEGVPGEVVHEVGVVEEVVGETE